MDKLSKHNTNPAALEPEPPSSGNAKEPHYHKSAGDVIFDFGVYGGLGFVANAAISLAVERYALQIPGSKLQILGQKAEKGFAHVFGQFIKKQESLDYWSKKANQVAFLGSGGWLLLVPMKWLEDHKTHIIRSIDEQLDTGPQTKQDIALQLSALQDGPKQSYGSLFTGRVVSYVATVTCALPFITKWTKTSDRLSLFLEKQLGHSIGELKHPTVIIGETQVPAFLNSVGIESILAGTSAVLHYGASKVAAYTGHHLLPLLPSTYQNSNTPHTHVKHIQYDARTHQEGIIQGGGVQSH